MRPDLDRPLPAAWPADRALQAYLDENGFTRAGYDGPRTEAAFLGIRFSVPNTPRHRWAIMRHDLHHVVTGYGTDLRGEGEISAWELRGGLRGLGLYVGAIVVFGTLLGLGIAPVRTIRAWHQNRGRSLLSTERDRDYDDLLRMTVGELRCCLGLPTAGVARRRRGLYALAPR